MARLNARLSFLVVCQLFAGASFALAHCPEIHKGCDHSIRTCQSNNDCPGDTDCTDAVCNDQSSATQCFINLTHAGTCTVDTQVTAAFDVQDFPSVPDQRVPDVGNLPIVTVSGNAVCGAGPSLPCVIGPAGDTSNGLPGDPAPGLVSFRSEHSLSAAQLQDLANAGAVQLNDQATVSLCTPGPDCNATASELQVAGSTSVSSGCSVANSAAGTPCQSDDNLCEAHACDGNGTCAAQ